MTKQKVTQGLGILWIALALLLTWSALALAGGDDTDFGPGDKNPPGSGGGVKPVHVPELKAGLLKPTMPGPRRAFGPDEFGPPNFQEMQKVKEKLLQPKLLPSLGGVESRRNGFPVGSDDR
jgi:hypothetical protein